MWGKVRDLVPELVLVQGEAKTKMEAELMLLYRSYQVLHLRHLPNIFAVTYEL